MSHVSSVGFTLIYLYNMQYLVVAIALHSLLHVRIPVQKVFHGFVFHYPVPIA